MLENTIQYIHFSPSMKSEKVMLMVRNDRTVFLILDDGLMWYEDVAFMPADEVGVFSGWAWFDHRRELCTNWKVRGVPQYETEEQMWGELAEIPEVNYEALRLISRAITEENKEDR